MSTSVDEFLQLKKVVFNGKKADLLAYINEYPGGGDALLATIFGTMPEFFNAEKARGQSANFQYRITTDSGPQEFYVKVHEGAVETGPGAVENPRVTLSAKLPEFCRVLTGKLNGMQAFLTGKVKLSGDMFAATKFETWFERP